MKYVLLCAAVIALLSLTVLHPEKVIHGTNRIQAYSKHILYQRDLLVEGVSILDSKTISESLPTSTSNVWWRFNSPQVVRTLASHPLVESVALVPCRWWSIRCFHMQIVERDAAFLARGGKESWVVGSDGGLMTPVPTLETESDLLEQLSKKLSLPIVDGLDSRQAPEVVRSRALYVHRSISSMEAALGFSVQRVIFKPSGELEVQFQEYPFIVIFGDSFKQASDLDLQITRLKKLLKELVGQERAVSKIDLAFNQVAVVSLTEAAHTAQSKLEKKLASTKASAAKAGKVR